MVLLKNQLRQPAILGLARLSKHIATSYLRLYQGARNFKKLLSSRSVLRFPTLHSLSIELESTLTGLSTNSQPFVVKRIVLVEIKRPLDPNHNFIWGYNKVLDQTNEEARHAFAACDE